MVETAAQAEAVGRICGAVTAAFSAPAEAENHNWRHDFAADRFQMLARHGALDRYFDSWFLVSVVVAGGGGVALVAMRNGRTWGGAWYAVLKRWLAL